MTYSFHPLAPVNPSTVATFGDQVPAQIGALWESAGVSRTLNGFVRVLDPARALQMTAGVVPFPEDVVPVFSTALADLICWWPSQNAFVVWKFRWGVIDALGGPDQTGQLIELLADDAFCDQP